MQYLLMAFRQHDNVREYSFKGTGPDMTPVDFIVDVDLALVRRHRIPMQDMPLLCRRLLEEKSVSEPELRITFPEERMQDLARRAEAEKASQESRRRGFFKPARPA